MKQRNYRAYLRSDVYQDTPDGPERPIWTYLVLPQRQPVAAIPPQPDAHMARAPYRGPEGKLLPSTVTWLREMHDRINTERARNGLRPPMRWEFD